MHAGARGARGGHAANEVALQRGQPLQQRLFTAVRCEEALFTAARAAAPSAPAGRARRCSRTPANPPHPRPPPRRCLRLAAAAARARWSARGSRRTAPPRRAWTSCCLRFQHTPCLSHEGGFESQNSELGRAAAWHPQRANRTLLERPSPPLPLRPAREDAGVPPCPPGRWGAEKRL